jgi:hypothetical protein
MAAVDGRTLADDGARNSGGTLNTSVYGASSDPSE